MQSSNSKAKKRGIEWPRASAEQLAAAGTAVRAVMRGSSGWPFSEPVTDAVAPGYSREIKKPMDLGTIATKLKQGKYNALGKHPMPYFCHHGQGCMASLMLT